MSMQQHTTTASLPSSADIELNCPRGAFPVELLNQLNTPFKAWRPVVARKDNIDMFGHPIRMGESHYMRTLGPGVVETERLTALSMDRVLWLVFGENLGLVECCRSLRKSQEAAEAQSLAKWHATANQPGNQGGGA